MLNEATVESKTLFYQEETSSKTRSWKGGHLPLPVGGLRGQERGINKHQNIKPGTPAEKKKYKLKTNRMSYAHAE